MNLAAFPSFAEPAIWPPCTHSKRVARSSLGETTTPRAGNLVVNFPIDGERHCESRAFPGFLQDTTERNRQPKRDAAATPERA
jgi:hypothetical protein